jgi:hypothetical protein
VAAEVRAHRTARAGPPTARRAAETPAEAPPTDLELELRELEREVHQKLNRRPAVLWARLRNRVARRPPPGQPSARAAPATVDPFAEAAAAARRRQQG